jgi:FMN-dependent NADH-azoreductase
MHRDLVDDNLPHLDGITLKAISTKDAAEAQNLKESATVSDKLTDELLASDLLIIATPTWSFGIPSSLKAWVDLVVRPGKTFSYTNDGVWGLAKGKKAILVLASGGVFTEGRWKSWDFVQPYLRKILSFIGIDSVQTVRAEGMNIRPLADSAVPKAERAVETLALQAKSRCADSLRFDASVRPRGVVYDKSPVRSFRSPQSILRCRHGRLTRTR